MQQMFEHNIEVGEIIGFRFWNIKDNISCAIDTSLECVEILTPDDIRYKVVPLSLVSGPTFGEVIWPTEKPLKAACINSHSVKGRYCTFCTRQGPAPCTKLGPFAQGDWNENRCGIYAWNTSGLIKNYSPEEIKSSPTYMTCGLVALSGRVIEHEFGYRAEFARPIALIEQNTSAMLRTVISDYGVDIYSLERLICELQAAELRRPECQ